MSSRVKHVAIAVAVIGLIGGAMIVASLGGYDPTAAPRSPLVGTEAPGFTLPLVAGEGAGDRVDLSALRGEVVALDFWASWCGPCRQSIPVLNRVHERYEDRVRMYGVNVEAQMSASQVQQAHRSFGAAFPSLHDQTQRAQAIYSVRSIPTLVLIDRDGVIQHLETGVPDEDDLAERLDELLADRR